ncbi:MAG: glutamine-hydrolyzing carbamoyl-phosphate synthase small subunit [Candidatus Aenigmarchaeota archaeon]|nr:glutamine-hydrolyzing carbamoyl-phosphate synthase small subunit [Candidatus Aenigmarchaeota archaeon]
MKRYLVLENGSVFEGQSFGSPAITSGEVVFNTGMTGYTETISDPSYKGQILCQTFPLIGNYGIDENDFESASPKIEGYVTSEDCKTPSHRSAFSTLHETLKKHGIPGISGIDTRRLTKILRAKGTMLGAISDTPIMPDIKDPNQTDLVSLVTVKQPIIYQGTGPTIAVIDCGAKENIIRSLLARDARVLRLPASYSADKIMSYAPQGILISNGPGDPTMAKSTISAVQQLMEYKIPIFGICLGMQILALSMGGATRKLKFGHRGQNHACIDVKTNKCYITSQNHGYEVNNLPDYAEATMLDINDRTMEGMTHKTLPFFAVQFHPEASPGPRDTEFLFDKFIELMKK